MYSQNPEGEIGLCSLASIVLGRVSDEEYEDIAYYTALIIDNVIEIMEYPFLSLETTAKARRSLGVGMTNLAYDLANRGLNYSGLEGKNHVHYVAERHSYWLHKASVRLARERGICDAMAVSKYRNGWLPIDSYNRNVDTVTTQSLAFDWESLRTEIKELKGIRHSVLEAYMPVESSSQLTNTTNGLYPIRNIKVIKSSGNNKNVLLAPRHTQLNYETAWELETKDLVEVYAIVQKFTGQAISSDLYLQFSKDVKTVPTRKLLQDFLHMVKLGLKTRYYINTAAGTASKTTIEDKGCGSGGCTL